MSEIDPLKLIQMHRDLSWYEVGRRIGISGGAARKRAARYRKRQKENPTMPAEEPALRGDFELEEALELADRLGNLLDIVDPITTSARIEFPSPRPVAIMFCSCAHIGGRYTFHRGVREVFDRMMETDGLYIGLLGDEIEGFLPGFRSAEAVMDQVLPFAVQREVLAKYLERWSAAGKVLFGCWSQHGGKWFEQQVGINPIKDEYRKTGTPYFDGRGSVTLDVGGEEYILVASHGFKGSSQYNPNHSQRRASLWDYPSADVIVQGDRHQYSVQHMSDRVDEYRDGLRASPLVWHLMVGTAKVGNDKYTIRNWQHGYFEWPVLLFYHDRHLIKQCFELDDLAYFLQEGGG